MVSCLLTSVYALPAIEVLECLVNEQTCNEPQSMCCEPVVQIPDAWVSLVANSRFVDLSGNRLWGYLASPWYNVTKQMPNTWNLTSVMLR